MNVCTVYLLFPTIADFCLCLVSHYFECGGNARISSPVRTIQNLQMLYFNRLDTGALNTNQVLT